MTQTGQDFDTRYQHASQIISSCDITDHQRHESIGGLQLSDALFCFEDIIRCRFFWQAIASFLSEQKKSDRCQVLDLGSWTGVLWCMALALGAQHCTFVESNPHSIDLSRTLLAALWYESRSTVLHQDARETSFDSTFDLIISETIANDMSEDFLAIINHNHRFLSPHGSLIPQTLELSDGTQTWTYDSTSLPWDAPVFTSWSTITGTMTLYKDVVMRSGDCYSLLNERVVG